MQSFPKKNWQNSFIFIIVPKINLNKISYFKNKKIIDCYKISESFGMLCEKLFLENGKMYILKRSKNNKTNYSALLYEGKSLKYMYDKFPKLFPKIYFSDKNYLVMEYIKHDKIKGNSFELELAKKISKIHRITNDKFGFKFDTPIGGLKQPSNYDNNWIKFYKEKRLGMIFNLINKSNPMPKTINMRLEKIIERLEEFLPKNPRISLIHGDLWEGNILFNNGKIVGLIDPGLSFAHNEMEISYLTWFKYVKKKFLNIYSEIIKIDKYYFKYEPIYQLYWCLLNVYLWDRMYIKNTEELLNKIK